MLRSKAKRVLTSIGYWLIALGCKHRWQTVNRDFTFCSLCDKSLDAIESAKRFDALGYIEPPLYGFTLQDGSKQFYLNQPKENA